MKIFIKQFLFIMPIAACMLSFDAFAQAKNNEKKTIEKSHSYKTHVNVGFAAYEATTKRWEKALSKASFSSSSWIWSITSNDFKHKNKSRDAILIVPDTSDSESITLVIWFHGLNGFGKRTFEKRLIPQLNDLVENGNSIALAIPEMPWSINTSTPRGRQGRVWRKKGELTNFIDQAKNRLNEWSETKHGERINNFEIVFVGHSAGGSALMSASEEGSLCSNKPKAILWSDASYGSWLKRAFEGCMKSLSQDQEVHILVRKWGKPHRQAEKVLGSKKSKINLKILYNVLNRKYWKHSEIGDNAILLTDIFPSGC